MRRYRAESRAKANSTSRPIRPRFSTERKREQRMGARVRASRSEISTATEMVTPNWKKNLPMMPFMKATGRKMATMAKVAAAAAKVISRAPTEAARTLPMPSSRCR